MRRIPPGQLQRFYKRLADLYQRYPNRWAKEKGYSDADYYLDRTRKLLMALKAGLEGRPLPGTGERPEFRRPGQFIPPERDYRRLQRDEEVYDQYAPEEDALYEEQMAPPPRNMITRSTGGRFVPKKSKSRSVRPAFLRRK